MDRMTPERDQPAAGRRPLAERGGDQPEPDDQQRRAEEAAGAEVHDVSG